MKRPVIKTGGQSTFHSDGTVSYWDVYRQQWQRVAAEFINDKILASLPAIDRERIMATRGLV
jgi:hypothetical protein